MIVMQQLRRALQQLRRIGAAPLLVPPAAAALTWHSTVATAAASTTRPDAATGAAAVSVATYQANEAIEDRHTIVSCNGRLTVGVFDGHGGWQASEFSSKRLATVLDEELQHAADPADPAQVATALSRAFQRLDRQWMDAVRGAFEVGFGEVNRVGCCAIATVVTPDHVVVANAGDCRAVLGLVTPTSPSPVVVKPKDWHLRDTVATTAEAGGAVPVGGDDVADASAQPWAAAGDKQHAEPVRPAPDGSVPNESGPGAVVARSETLDTAMHQAGRASAAAKAAAAAAAMRRAAAAAAAAASTQHADNQHHHHQQHESDDGSSLLVHAIPLSEDHNARMPREKARLAAAHPGEHDIVVCSSPDACYVKGRLQPTRAIGDLSLKYSEFNRPESGRYIKAPYSPPYITATPEVRALWVRDTQKRRQLRGSALGGDHGAHSAVETIVRLQRPAALAAGGTGALTVAEAAARATSGAGGSGGGGSGGGGGGVGGSGLALASYATSASGPAALGINNDPTFSTGIHIADTGIPRGAFLIVACDGIWDAISSEDAVKFVAEDTGDVSGVAARLVFHCLQREADASGMTLDALTRLKPGRERRRRHDDMTAVIVFLGDRRHLDDAGAAAAGAEAIGTAVPAGGKPWWQFW